MQFILHRGKELLGNFRPRVVVDTGRVNIRHLLVEITLGGANVADSLQEFPEIAIAALLQAFVIQRKPLLNILMQPRRRPTAKPGCHRRLHPISDRNHHIQIVMVDLTFDLTLPLLTN